MCCPENFVQKTKSCSLVTQNSQKNYVHLCLLWLVSLSTQAAETLAIPPYIHSRR